MENNKHGTHAYQRENKLSTKLQFQQFDLNSTHYFRSLQGMNIQMMEKEEKRHKETRYLVQLKGMLFVKKKKKKLIKYVVLPHKIFAVEEQKMGFPSRTLKR